MKGKIQKEYLRTRKLLRTKLSSRNFIKGINTWAVPRVRYSGPFLKWTSELKQIDQRTIEKNMEHGGDNYTNRDWCFWYSHQRIIKGARGLGGWRTSGDDPNYCIIENDQNTEKSLRDSRKLAVTQTSVKDHQLTLMWKTLKEFCKKWKRWHQTICKKWKRTGNSDTHS